MSQNRRKSAYYVQTSVSESRLVRQRTEKLAVLHVAALVLAVLKPLSIHPRVKFTSSEVGFLAVSILSTLAEVISSAGSFEMGMGGDSYRSCTEAPDGAVEK